MLYSGLFNTKNKDIKKYIDGLMTQKAIDVPPKIAQEIGRNKVIQNIRDMDRINPYILIGGDQKYHRSIIKIRDPVKIRKIGERYYFSL